MISQDVTIPVNGEPMSAYLARPAEGSGPHPAVIVLGEVFGFTPEVRRVADLVESIGYVGLAIDYYHRTNPKMVEPYTEDGNHRAFAAAAKVSAGNFADDVRAAADWLNAQPFVKSGKLATWGFGFGATGAFVSSCRTELSGAICFYPGNVATPMGSGGEAPLLHASEVSIPILIVFGEKDYYVSRFDMDRIYHGLKSAGKDVRMQIYPNVGHSFFRHGRPEAVIETQRYSDESVAQAVADSWDLVRVFLREVFSRPQAHEAVSGGSHTAHKAPLRH